MKNLYSIIAINGHYEVYNSMDEFVLSGDTYAECEHDVRELESGENAA